MVFRAAFLVLALLAASVAGKTIVPDFDVKAGSRLGRKLMKKARALNEERDWTWVATYNIKYRGCSSIVSLAGEEQGGGEDGNMLYTQNLVKFSLCPDSDDCTNCKGGADYVVNMMDFVDAWTENKMNALEQACENIRENCYCNNQYNDDEACENQCYNEAEMSECIQVEGQEEFEIQRYLECAEMENQNGNNNNNQNYNNGEYNGNWYGSYFIGPYCSEKDGYSIHLGVFYDEGCSAHADVGVYAQRNYGVELPFSSESIVQQECISCMQVDENNNNNNNNNNNGNNNGNNYYYQELEVNELCAAVYEPAAKCESNADVNWPINTGCEYIQNILPRLEKATRGKSSKKSSSGGSGAAVGFAWFFGISTIIFASYAFFLYRKLDRNRVDLSSSDGAMA